MLVVATHLKLVLAGLGGGGWVEKIDCENLRATTSARVLYPVFFGSS